MRNIDTKIDNTAPAASGRLKAAQWNSMQNELENLVVSAGIALDETDGPDTDQRMMAQAIARYASSAIFATDSGVANAYVLSLIGDFQPPKAYFRGMHVVFYPGAANTGAGTINAFALGIKKFLRPNASALEAADVAADRLMSAWYDPAADGGNGAFRMAPWCQPVAAGGGGGDGYPQAGQGIAVDPSFYVALNFPSLVINDPSDEDIFAFWDVSAGNHRGVTWGRMKQLLQVYLDGGVVGGGGPGGGTGCTPIYVTGNRTASITASSSLTLSSGAPSALVDGDTVAATWRPATQSVIGKYIRFDFATPKLVTEAKAYASGASNIGSWKWQVSTDASTWIDVGSPFTLGGVPAGQIITALGGNVTAYRYYQLVGVTNNDNGSGQTTFDDPAQLTEFEFKQCG